MNESKYLNLFAEITGWSDKETYTKVTFNLSDVEYKDVISLLATIYIHISRNLKINPLEMIDDTSAVLTNIKEILKDD